MSPRELGYRVLSHCKRQLGLPHMRIRWDDAMDHWQGEYDPGHPDVISVPAVLLEQPDLWKQVVYVVAHECLHASIVLAVRDGRIPGHWLVDEALNEKLAVMYGRRVADEWNGYT